MTRNTSTRMVDQYKRAGGEARATDEEHVRHILWRNERCLCVIPAQPTALASLVALMFRRGLPRFLLCCLHVHTVRVTPRLFVCDGDDDGGGGGEVEKTSTGTR